MKQDDIPRQLPIPIIAHQTLKHNSQISLKKLSEMILMQLGFLSRLDGFIKLQEASPVLSWDLLLRIFLELLVGWLLEIGWVQLEIIMERVFMRFSRGWIQRLEVVF